MTTHSLQRQEQNNALTTTIVCRDFVDAVWYLNRLVPLIESHQHHPDITIKDYKILEISLTTHDQGHTITDKDKNLAQAITEFIGI